jgi:hypothetical protein
LTEQLSDRRFYDVDRLRDGIAESSDRWKNRFTLDVLNIAKEYMGGDFCVVLERKSRILGEATESEGFPFAQCFTVPEKFGKRESFFSVVSYQDQFINVGRVGDWCQNAVLVRTVEKMNDIKKFTLSAGKRLKRLQNVIDGGVGCFYSFTCGFKSLALVPHRELNVLILISRPNQFPNHVIESGPQIVDSIAYCQGDVWRWREHDECNIHLPVIQMRDRSIEILPREGDKPPFQITDVMIGPFDLQLGAIEHG